MKTKIKMGPIATLLSAMIFLSCKLDTESKKTMAANASEDTLVTDETTIEDFPKAESAETQFVDTNGVTYAYRKIGKGEGIPLLMLTRFRANMDDWDPQFLNALGQQRPVIVFNNSGVASSSGEVPTTIKGAADDAASFARALGYEQIDVLGWSMAGFTGQVIAIEYPQLVRKVVLIGTGPGGSPETSPPFRPEVFEIATKGVSTNTIWEEKDHQFLFFAADTQEGEQAVKASLERIGNSRRSDEPVTTDQVMQNQSAAITAFWFEAQGDYFSKLKDLKQPTLIINGDRDAFFDMKGQWLLHREIPNSRLAIYPMAGHGPQHQFPEHVGATINTFLN